MPEEGRVGRGQGAGEGELRELRKQVDSLDAEIVRLLNERASLSVEIGKAKQTEQSANGRASVYSPGREAEVVQGLVAKSKGPLPAAGLRAIYSEIISSSRALQAPPRIAFLGPEATFSHQAALAHFGEASTLLAVPSIPDV